MSPEGFDGDEMAENYRIYTLKKILSSSSASSRWWPSSGTPRR